MKDKTKGIIYTLSAMLFCSLPFIGDIPIKTLEGKIVEKRYDTIWEGDNILTFIIKTGKYHFEGVRYSSFSDGKKIEEINEKYFEGDSVKIGQNIAGMYHIKKKY